MQKKSIRSLCEGAVMVALAQALSYLKIYELPWGGSVTLAMVPIVFFAVRWGLARGLLASFVFGLLQFMFDGAFAYTWQAIILDYIIAFGLLGFAGLFARRKSGVFTGTLLAVVLRFLAHLLSGVYVWAEYMPDVFFGMQMTNVWLYSFLYNGLYMGANLILTLVVFAILYKPMNRYILAKDITMT